MQQATVVLHYPSSVKRGELLHFKLKRWKDLSATGRRCPTLPLQCKERGTAALQVEKVDRFEFNRLPLSYTTPPV